MNSTTAHWTFDRIERTTSTATADGGLRIAGYLSDFDVDFENDAFTPGALRAGIREALSIGWPVLLNHDWKQPVGRVVDARVDSKGLFIEAEIEPPEPGTYAAQFIRLVKAGAINAWSIGGKWTRQQFGSVRKIVAARIMEASLCVQGMNDRARFEVVAGGKMFDVAEDFDGWIEVKRAAWDVQQRVAAVRRDDARRLREQYADIFG